MGGAGTVLGLVLYVLITYDPDAQLYELGLVFFIVIGVIFLIIMSIELGVCCRFLRIRFLVGERK